MPRWCFWLLGSLLALLFTLATIGSYAWRFKWGATAQPPSSPPGRRSPFDHVRD